MWDLFSFSFWADFWQLHHIWVMFVAAFLSATILPGNSEIVFVALATPKVVNGFDINEELIYLILVASVGNTLGSLTTYWIGYLLPPLTQKKTKTKSIYWALEKLQRFGSVFLLLSWLPVVGDVLCAVAGWLRLNFYASAVCIFIGKALRYIGLLLITFPFIY